jgi:PAS domain S-box-containing protein
MNYQNKTKDELIKELQKLKQEYDSLKTSCSKDISEFKQAEEALSRQKDALLKLNNFSIGLSKLTLEDNLEVFIVRQLKEITGAKAVIFSEYSHINRTTTTKHIEIDSRLLKKVVSLLGQDIYKIHSEVSEELYCIMTSEIIGTRKTLFEATFGAIPRHVAAAVQSLVKADRFIGLAYIIEGKIYGTSLLAMSKGQSDPPKEILETFMSLAAVSLRRKKAEEVLRESEAQYRLLFENSSEAIFLTNPDGSIYSANPEACRIYGRSEDEICKLGRSCTSDLNDPRLELAIEERKKTGKFKGELNQVRKDGTIFPAEVTSTIYVDTSGNERTCMIVRDISERKLFEKELYLQMEIMQNISEGINLIRVKDEVIVFTNPKFDKMFGYNSEELIGKPVSILNAPSGKSSEEIKQDIVDTANRTGEWHGEILNIKKNGDNFWCYVNVSVFNHPDFGMMYLSVHTNISKRKKAEEALQDSERQYRQLFDQMLNGLMVCEVICDERGFPYDHRFVQGNKAFEQLTGLSLKEQLGRSGKDFAIGWPPEVIQKLYKVAMTGESIRYERFNETLGRFYETRVFSPRKGQFALIFTDITERKHVEEALIENEAKFRSLFENSLVGISIARPDGRLLQVNQAYARLYGYEYPGLFLSEVSDTTVLFAHPEERKEVIQELHRNGYMEPKEFELIRHDGSHFFALVSACEIRDSEGKLLYNQATHIDLTERKQVEEEIRISKKLLEDLYMHQVDIRENERALISREIHDELGQSMTALKLDLKRMHKYVGASPEAIMKLDSMIELVSNTIKDVQRISSDLRPGILDDLGLVPAIEWYCDEFEKRTEIKCFLKVDNSDYNNSEINLTLFRILQEALTNVIRHAMASIVKVKLHQSQKGIILNIQDNGIGIRKKEIDSHKSMGLISMHERIKQFKGKIDILSLKGNGTKLTIFIPSQKMNLK